MSSVCAARRFMDAGIVNTCGSYVFRDGTADGGDRCQNKASRFDALDNHTNESCFVQEHICAKKVLHARNRKDKQATGG
jgi:hypothetical protein